MIKELRKQYHIVQKLEISENARRMGITKGINRWTEQPLDVAKGEVQLIDPADKYYTARS